MHEWLSAAAQRYPGVELIDVVNEPLHETPAVAAALGGSGSTGWDWVVEGFRLAGYRFAKYKSDADAPPAIERLLLVAPDPPADADLRAAWQRLDAVLESVELVRDLVNEPATVKTPTYLATRAKQRSKHNSFLTLPLVFLMISSHFPTASYGQRLNWLVLWVFLLGGFAARAAINAWDHRA